MQPHTGLRPGELTGTWAEPTDAALCFIGRISTPWRVRGDCPKRGDSIDGPICRVEIFEPWHKALKGIGGHSHLQLLYWMHLSRRDLLQQRPHGSQTSVGTFSVRSPARPNPIAVSRVALIEVQDDALMVRGLDCLDGTFLIDVKPEHCPMAGH